MGIWLCGGGCVTRLFFGCLVPHFALHPPIAVGAFAQNEEHLSMAVERWFAAGHLDYLMFGAPLGGEIA